MFQHPFAFQEESSSPLRGILQMDAPIHPAANETAAYRNAEIQMENGASLPIVLYHNPSTAKFIYLWEGELTGAFAGLVGLQAGEFEEGTHLCLPGQLCMGALRTGLIGRAIAGMLAQPILTELANQYHQDQVAVFPIAREGLKYQVSEGLQEVHRFFCDEIILDAHHVFDRSVPLYNRKVEMTLFKDKDLDAQQKLEMRVAIIADSIASGLVMNEVIHSICERFTNLERVEIIAPLASLRGLCRIIPAGEGPQVRVHVFETLLNALPPDYYYSAHFHDPQFHIDPEMEAEYRGWWGSDAQGKAIADTACAGYGWSEAFYSPRKQIQMMNGELRHRHGLTIADILRKKLRTSC